MANYNKRMKIEEVALVVGVSVKTINNWYAWKRENPEHELAKLLPNYVQEGERQTRYWNYSDIHKLANFKANVPKGRNGILAGVTQKYRKKKED